MLCPEDRYSENAEIGRALPKAARQSNNTAIQSGARPHALKTANTVDRRRMSNGRYKSTMQNPRKRVNQANPLGLPGSQKVDHRQYTSSSADPTKQRQEVFSCDQVRVSCSVRSGNATVIVGGVRFTYNTRLPKSILCCTDRVMERVLGENRASMPAKRREKFTCTQQPLPAATAAERCPNKRIYGQVVDTILTESTFSVGAFAEPDAAPPAAADAGRCSSTVPVISTL